MGGQLTTLGAITSAKGRETSLGRKECIALTFFYILIELHSYNKYLKEALKNRNLDSITLMFKLKLRVESGNRKKLLQLKSS